MLATGVGLAFVRVLYSGEDLADRLWRGPAWLRPAAGGILLGLLLLAVPQMYSYAAAHRNDVVKLVVSEAPLPDPSIYNYPALTARGPGLWWFGLFNEPGNLAQHLFAGKEKQWVYGSIPTLELVKNAVTPCDLALFTHYLEQPGHLQATIDWFSTFHQDIKNDAVYGKTKLTIPVLAIGAKASLGGLVAEQFRHYATHVTGLVIPNTGHWLYEEHSTEMTRILLRFLGYSSSRGSVPEQSPRCGTSGRVDTTARAPERRRHRLRVVQQPF